MTARQAPDAMPAMSDFLGIDPGASGGIALVGNGVVQAWAMPDTERDTYDFLKDLAPQVSMAYLERVSAMRGWGTSTTWKFGQHYGMLRAFLIALGIPFETVAPGVWQKNMGCLSHGDKRVTKRRAQELFPHLKITNATADALLIAEFGRRHG